MSDDLEKIIARAMDRSLDAPYRIHVVEQLGELGMVSDKFVQRRPRVKIIATFEHGKVLDLARRRNEINAQQRRTSY